MALLIDIFYSAMLTGFLSFGFFLALKYARTFLMCYGEFVILGGYISTFQQQTLTGWLTAIAISALLGALSGAAIYLLLRNMFQRYRTRDSLLVTWGAALVLMESYRLSFGPAGRFAPSFSEGVWYVVGAAFPQMRALNLLAIVILSCALAAAIHALNRRNRLTALAFGHQVASEYGVPVPRLLLATLALTGAVACVAGVLVGQETAITPYGGLQYTILAALAALVAGPRLWSGVFVAASLAGIRAWLGFEFGLTPAWLVVLLLVVLGASLQRNSVTLDDKR